METSELWENLREAWNTEILGKEEEPSVLADKRIRASILKERIEEYIKGLDEVLKLKVDEKTSWTNDECGKVLEMSFKKSSTIDPKIMDELTDEECRKGFTVTQKAIEASGRKDLLDKYKTITEAKILTLKSIKG